MFWNENLVVEEEEEWSAIIAYADEMMYKTSLKSFSSIDELVQNFLTFFDMAGTLRNYKLVVKDQKLVLKTNKTKNVIKEETEITEYSMMKILVKSNPTKTVWFTLIPYDHLTMVYLQKCELKPPFLTKDSALTEEELRVIKKSYHESSHRQVKAVTTQFKPPISQFKPPISKFKSSGAVQNAIKKQSSLKESQILKDFDLAPSNLNTNSDLIIV